METKQLTTKDFFARADVKAKFTEILKTRSTQFMTSVLQIVTNNALLAKADPASIYNAAMVAATLDLPLNNNLGFAYIVPYGNQAQFQMGYRGFIQLAQRSGLFKTIAMTEIYEGQLVEENPLTGFLFDFKAKTSNVIIGYAAFFSLSNGFEKTLYMSKEQITAHAKRFSKTFGSGPWQTDFDAMAKKTVLKMLLSKYAPLSVEMQQSVKFDQAVVEDVDSEDYSYIDNPEEVPVVVEIEKPKAPKAKAQEVGPLSDSDFSKLIEMVRGGDMTASLQAKKGYALTIEQLSDLQDAEDFYNSQTH